MSSLITEIKHSVVPILCHDTKWKKDSGVFGTCVILGNIKKECYLTCEHVVAIKDSTKKTIGYISDFYIQMNYKNDSGSQWVRVDLLYADEKNDFAILTLSKNQNLDPNIYSKEIQPSLWKETKDLKEGESVLYVGYPMFLGIENTNHPLSRTGMISQLIQGRNSFLIDGFVQHGHSGSPVFLIEPVPNIIPEQWHFYLIGIATSFPDEFTDVYEQIKLVERPKTQVLINPGFTFVTSMNTIIPVLKKKMGF